MDRFNKRQKLLMIIIVLLFIIMYIADIYYTIYEKPQFFDSNNITLSVIIYFLCFAVISFVFIYLLNTIAYYEKIYCDKQSNLKQIELISQRKKVLEKNNKIYLENYRKQVIVLEDIYQKIKQNQNIDFESYDVMEQYHIQYCDNVYIDTLLYSKYLYALENNIFFDIDVVYTGYFIDDIDMNTILFNLIDNAFEAATLTDERKVSLKLREVKGIVYISILNTKENMHTNLYKTSKKDKDNHGLGIGIVEDVIKDYQGKIDYKDQGHVMEICLTLFNKGK